MYHMRTTIRRLGNSQGITIPKRVLDEAGFAVDVPVDLLVDGDAIVIRRASADPRRGWAEAAATIADDAGDREWMEADLDSESRAELTW
jgi:antitoxin MazE